MKTYEVEVVKTSVVEVTIDETKFTPEFMQEFNSYMFKADMDEHIKTLAYHAAYDDSETFIEGYGNLKEMGIELKCTYEDEESTIL